MNKIEKLIKEKCQNGVIFKTLSKICKISKGKQLNKNELYSEGLYPVINGGISPSGYWNEFNYNENLITISQGGASAGYVTFQDTKFWAGAHCYVVESCNTEINYKYLYHFLKEKQKVLQGSQIGAGIPSVSLKEIYNLRIPIPPIEIQEEIVKILDKFRKLETELESELETRKSQYDYYREKLCGGNIITLKERKDIQLLKLSDLGDIIRGKRFVKADAVDSGIPCIHYGELYTYYGISADKTKSMVRSNLASKLRYASKNDVIIVGAGENNIDIGIGVAWLGNDDVAIHDACYILKHNINPKYISYYLRTNLYHSQLKNWVSEGKICAVSGKGIGESIIPVPSIEKQKEIVNKLDKFDKLINSITEGIPAEIEARRKQYEYYRNKLLSFEEVSSE